MDALGEQTVGELIEALAAPSPAPGGGSSAALACALAAGLAEMTAAIAGELRRRALELADRELGSYRPVLAAIREAGGRADRDRRLGEALAAASEPPLEIARAAAGVGAVALGVGARAAAARERVLG